MTIWLFIFDLPFSVFRLQSSVYNQFAVVILSELRIYLLGYLPFIYLVSVFSRLSFVICRPSVVWLIIISLLSLVCLQSCLSSTVCLLSLYLFSAFYLWSTAFHFLSSVYCQFVFRSLSFILEFVFIYPSIFI